MRLGDNVWSTHACYLHLPAADLVVRQLIESDHVVDRKTRATTAAEKLRNSVAMPVMRIEAICWKLSNGVMSLPDLCRANSVLCDDQLVLLLRPFATEHNSSVTSRLLEGACKRALPESISAVR